MNKIKIKIQDSPLFTHKHTAKHPVAKGLIFNIYLPLKGKVKENTSLKVI
jgi:hypothetical protein